MVNGDKEVQGLQLPYKYENSLLLYISSHNCEISLLLFVAIWETQNTQAKVQINLRCSFIGSFLMEKYELIKEKNKRGFFEGRSLITSKIVTLKQLVVHPVEGVPASLIKEISLLHELENPNVIRLLEVVNSKHQTTMVLVYERMEMDLKGFMCIYPTVMTSPWTRKVLLRQILNAVSFFHSYNLIHGKIKPENIFVDPDTKVLKVTDFIWPRSILNQDSGDPHEDSTYNYMAPEILIEQKQYTTALDVWSVGCVFAEMVTKTPLFPAKTEFHQLLKIFSIMGTPHEETWPGIDEMHPHSYIYSRSEPKDLRELVPGLEPAGIDLLNIEVSLYDDHETYFAKVFSLALMPNVNNMGIFL
ncbi:hypothetical protein L6452_18462 [Arctium lappa]|uniref:Uncharacterized protein n=1 Tax=Arctium lappa TaxID=4217 RepID=A0ACB9C673_ARCLA|nr:hypothetical protein L6452_18462 [Arctium lappa]